MDGAAAEIMAGLDAFLADDESADLDFPGFDIQFVDAVVADERIGRQDDLAGIGRIGQNFLIADHAGIENNFPVGIGSQPRRSNLRRPYHLAEPELLV